MNKAITRNPHALEIHILQSIWRNVFGSVGEESFFIHFYDPQLCIIAEYNKTPVSAGYLIPFGNMICGLKSIPCAMIYSVATLSEFRGKGLGTAVVNELITLANKIGYPAVVLCPVNDEVFNYYTAHTDFREGFYINEQIITEPHCNSQATPLTEVSFSEYDSLREEILEGAAHIKHDLRVLEYQALLCKELGGGFFKFGDACCVVERQPCGDVWVKELLTPKTINNDQYAGSLVDDLLSSIMPNFPSSRYVVRTPSKLGTGNRFGMLSYAKHSELDLSISSADPWYGMAFD